MKKISNGGVWECFVADAKQYDNYKYHIETKDDIPQIDFNEYNEENVQKFINQFIRAKQEFGESTDIAETTSADDFSF